MSAVDWALLVDRGEQVELDEPEELTDHLVYLDQDDRLYFNVMPGTALCGYVFTTETDAGPAELAPGVHVQCRPLY